MLSVVRKFNRDFSATFMSCKNSPGKCPIVWLTVNTWMGNFGLGMIKSLFQLQVFLQSMASMHHYELGIYIHTAEMQTHFSRKTSWLSVSSKDCLFTKIYCFWILKTNLRVVFHFLMMDAVFKLQQRFYYFLDTDCQKNGCSLSMSAPYARVFTAIQIVYP